MSPRVEGPYLWRAWQYTRHAGRVGAFDEHRLFASVALPPAPGEPWPGEAREPSPAWASRLAASKTRSLLVLRDGAVSTRWTAPGDAPGRPGRLYSITKSVLSLAVGIARAEGRFPALDADVHRGLSPRNLLRMDSGLAFDEGLNRLNRQTHTYLHPDARRTAASSPLVDPVARHFHYNDYHSLLLGRLLEQGLESTHWRPASDLPLVAAWISERLLRPLGQQHEGRFVLDSARHSFPKTESGLCLSADDVARLGQLVLQGGRWQGKQLVPADWVARSTSRDEGWSGAEPFALYRNLAWGPWLSRGQGFYAWHWWGRREAQGRDTVFALGIHGQILVVSPRHRAVAVRLADRWAFDGWWPDALLEGLERGEL